MKQVEENPIRVFNATSQEQMKQVFAIRQKVFVEEQNCQPELEWEFEDEAVHFLAFAGGRPAGTARWRKTEGGYKLERFAVLQEFRGCGVGKELVLAVLRDLPDNAKLIYLHAQVQALQFYQKLGFEAKGEMFEEAGIQHYKMIQKQ